MKARFFLFVALLLCLVLGGAAFVQAAPGPTLWARQFGTPQNDSAFKVVTDQEGNVYVAGMTYGTIPGGTNTNQGGADVFLAKFDPQGTMLWTVQFGSGSDDGVGGIAFDNSGFVYVSGWTRGTMPGGIDLPPNVPGSGVDAFVAKIDTSGTLRWIRQIDSGADDFGYGVATDRTGTLYVVGSTWGSIDGMTDPENHTDAFVAQLQNTGELIKIVQFNVAAIPADDCAYGIVIDTNQIDSDYAYITGVSRGNESGSLFIVKIKLDPSLGQVWVRTYGGPGNGSDNDTGYAITLDNSQNVIVAGSTQGAFDGNSQSGEQDAVVLKLDGSGNKIWSRQFGSAAQSEASGVAADSDDNIFVTGTSQGALDGNMVLGSSDIFLLRLTPGGSQVYLRRIESSARDWGNGIAVDVSGALYLVGATEGLPGEQPLGASDAVLIRCDKNVPVPPTEYVISGTVKKLPSQQPLAGVSVTVKDDQGASAGNSLTDASGRFTVTLKKPGTYSLHKFKLGYRPLQDPEDVTVSETVPSVSLTSYMEKILPKTKMTFTRGYGTVQFAKLPRGDHSLQAVFGKELKQVGLIISFEWPMRWYIRAHKGTGGNLKELEFGHSYLVYVEKTFDIDTTDWEPAPLPDPPSWKHHDKIHR